MRCSTRSVAGQENHLGVECRRCLLPVETPPAISRAGSRPSIRFPQLSSRSPSHPESVAHDQSSQTPASFLKSSNSRELSPNSAAGAGNVLDAMAHSRQLEANLDVREDVSEMLVLVSCSYLFSLRFGIRNQLWPGPIGQQTAKGPRVRRASQSPPWALSSTGSLRENVETLDVRLPTVSPETKNKVCRREPPVNAKPLKSVNAKLPSLSP